MRRETLHFFPETTATISGKNVRGKLGTKNRDYSSHQCEKEYASKEFTSKSIVFAEVKK